MCGERGQTQTLILTFSFSVVVLTRICSLDSSSQFRSGCDTPFRSSLQMGAIIFSRLYIVVTRVQLSSLHRRVSLSSNPFPVFYPSATPLPAFSFEFLPANRNSLLICCLYVLIFNPGVCCYDNFDFPFLFVCLFSYLFLSFTPSRGGLINIAENTSQSIGVPNYFTQWDSSTVTPIEEMFGSQNK